MGSELRVLDGDMKNWMDCAHAAGQTEGERVSTCLSNNFERSEVLLREFLRGSSGANVVRLDKYLVSDDKVWRRSLAFVSRS